MRPRKHHLRFVAVLGAAIVALPAIPSAATGPPEIEAINEEPSGVYSTSHHRWAPPTTTVIGGAVVTIKNPSTTLHGVEWVGGAPAPDCNGVPEAGTLKTSGKEWEGTCKFTDAGTYTFYCTVHGPEMTETVTVTIPGAPTVASAAVSPVSPTEVNLNGTVNPQEKTTEYHFNYGTTTSYGQTTAPAGAGAGDASQPVLVPVSSLKPGATYHFQLVATNSAGTSFSPDRTFTTPLAPGAPGVSTGAATSVSETAATLTGTVNPDGEATTYFFEWGLGTSYGQLTEDQPAGADHAGHGALATLSELQPGTLYHFRLVAKNNLGVVEGADQTFTTGSPVMPVFPQPPPTTPTAPGPSATQASVAPTPITTTTGVASALGAPLVGGPSLRSGQHGTSVKGSLDVSAGGAGARMEVDLFAKGASLAPAKRSASVLVGHLLRSSVSAGNVSFVVKLDAKAQSALRRHHKLVLSVKITLTPKHGSVVTVTRRVVLSR